MGAGRQLGKAVGHRFAPRVADVAPQATSSVVREALHRAIDGFGPLPPIRKAAARQLAKHDGDVDSAIGALTDNHVRYAGAQGLLTNVGGLTTAALTMPANITGLAVVQLRLVAAVAHLRGHDLDDARVRNAVLVTILGPRQVDSLVAAERIPGPPMALATAPVHDASLEAVVAAEVAAELVGRVGGRRIATTVGKRVPLLGGMVGMGADGWSTYRVGRYAEAEFLPRTRR